jgi:hypothetical protein
VKSVFVVFCGTKFFYVERSGPHVNLTQEVPVPNQLVDASEIIITMFVYNQVRSFPLFLICFIVNMKFCLHSSIPQPPSVVLHVQMVPMFQLPYQVFNLKFELPLILPNNLSMDILVCLEVMLNGTRKYKVCSIKKHRKNIFLL